jgi:hypothetical protein
VNDQPALNQQATEHMVFFHAQLIGKSIIFRLNEESLIRIADVFDQRKLFSE